MTKQRCDVCNSIMFEAKPFKTTQPDIIEFAQKSSLPEEQKQSILQNRWIHPGYYCPNGCSTVLVDSPIPLPPMSLEKQIATATIYIHEHFPEFLQTHDSTSRIVCCAFCQKFGGAILEDQSPTALYRQPDLSPFRNKKIVSAECSDPRIRNLTTKWWYSKGTIQAECRYFEYGTSFRWIYKSVTGWSEYASE
jgi:hypothetical protein